MPERAPLMIEHVVACSALLVTVHGHNVSPAMCLCCLCLCLSSLTVQLTDCSFFLFSARLPLSAIAALMDERSRPGALFPALLCLRCLVEPCRVAFIISTLPRVLEVGRTCCSAVLPVSIAHPIPCSTEWSSLHPSLTLLVFYRCLSELSARLAWVASSGGGHLWQMTLSSVLRPRIYTTPP